MGRDKTRFTIGGETLLERTVRVLGEVADEVLVVGPGAAPASARSLPDAPERTGPLAGLLAGVRAMTAAHAIVVASDHPYLDSRCLHFLAELATSFEAVVPRRNGHPQPTHAVYAKEVAAKITDDPDTNRSLRGLLRRLDVRWVEESELRAVDPELRSLINVNTQEEWERVVCNLPR